MHYQVKLDTFEGPLDLLLHLIHRLEIDIYDIPVAVITEQYLLYIHTMKELQLDIASEYLVMAATLLAIKSKMLLPKHEETQEEPEYEHSFEADPRDELVEKLVEYRKYKEAASDLRHLEEERNLIFSKPPSDLSDLSVEVKQTNLDVNVTVYDMLGALQKLMRRKKLQRPLSTKITKQEISIEKRMTEILVELKRFKGRKRFFELFPLSDKEHIVVSFLAILELMKRHEIQIEQEGNFSEIFVMAMEGVELVGNH
jgi:segregation and condensation protein A